MATTSEAPATAAAHTTVRSSLGDLTVVTRDGAVCGLYFPRHWHRPDPAGFGRHQDDGFDEVRQQLEQYLAGQRRDFDVAVHASGRPFQQRVWDLLAQIPYGTTVTYGELARELGGGVTAQETGAAVGRNPVSILIPCHRVVGAGGALTGYAGGLRRKRTLLDLEQDTAGGPVRLF